MIAAFAVDQKNQHFLLAVLGLFRGLLDLGRVAHQLATHFDDDVARLDAVLEQR